MKSILRQDHKATFLCRYFFDASLTRINRLYECSMFISNYIFIYKMPLKKLPEWLNTQS